METPNELKQIVQDKYSAIASGTEVGCCGPCGCTPNLSFADSYEGRDGYVPEADLALGCGIPTDAANIQEGDTVVDLGSGAGNDAFVARRLVGEHGKVIGVDFTPAMIRKAQNNASRLGYTNVEFVQGDIEALLLPTKTADVVVSNCVLNLVPDKKKAFTEMYRILKPGGRFTVSDIIVEGELPAEVRKVAELYAGCVSGAVAKEQYLGIMKEIGFVDVIVHKERNFLLPEAVLREYLSPAEITKFRATKTRILSMTVSGIRPA